MLFCLRGFRPEVAWNEAPLRTSFWALNFELAGMALSRCCRFVAQPFVAHLTRGGGQPVRVSPDCLGSAELCGTLGTSSPRS